jgi:hypothetical protein
MSYIVRVRFTKTDDNQWFWLANDNTGVRIFELLKQLYVLNQASELPWNLLFATEPDSLRQAAWDIPAQDENHVQEITIKLITWMNEDERQAQMTELKELFFQHYPTWAESMTVDAV